MNTSNVRRNGRGVAVLAITALVLGAAAFMPEAWHDNRAAYAGALAHQVAALSAAAQPGKPGYYGAQGGYHYRSGMMRSHGYGPAMMSGDVHATVPGQGYGPGAMPMRGYWPSAPGRLYGHGVMQGYGPALNWHSRMMTTADCGYGGMWTR